MVRKTTDGLIRFSSFNDVSRVLTRFSPNTIASRVAEIEKASNQRVAQLIGAQEFFDESVYICSAALSACYAKTVIGSMPENGNIAEVRSKLLDYVREYLLKSEACLGQLNVLATHEAMRRKINLPRTYIKALSECTAADVVSGWRYVSCGNRYVLAHVTEMQQLHCAYLNSEQASTENQHFLDDKVVGFVVDTKGKTSLYVTGMNSSGRVYFDDCLARDVASNRLDAYKTALREAGIQVQ